MKVKTTSIQQNTRLSQRNVKKYVKFMLCKHFIFTPPFYFFLLCFRLILIQIFKRFYHLLFFFGYIVLLQRDRKKSFQKNKNKQEKANGKMLCAFGQIENIQSSVFELQFRSISFSQAHSLTVGVRYTILLCILKVAKPLNFVMFFLRKEKKNNL